MRGGRKYELHVKPILKILQNLQEIYNYHIYHVYIIKPETFWQKQKTSFASSKYNFEVIYTLKKKFFLIISFQNKLKFLFIIIFKKYKNNIYSIH